MNEQTYPKIKYQGVEIKPGQHHTENPGYIYRKVNDPAEEAGLGDGWYDSPRPAIDAFKAGSGARDKAELEQLRARIAELEAAGPAPANANAPAGGRPEGDEQPRATEEWPLESEKRRRR